MVCLCMKLDPEQKMRCVAKFCLFTDDVCTQPHVPSNVAPPCSVGKEACDVRRKLKNVRNQNYRLTHEKKTGGRGAQKDRKQTVIKELSNFLPKNTFEFVVSQINAFSKKCRGHKWSDKDKALALALFHTSPKAYRLLKKIFILPAVSTLRRTMQNVQVYPGFSQNILQALKLKVDSMPPKSRLVSVVLDEMSIKEAVVYNRERDEVEGLEDFGTCGRSQYVANHALAFMVKGIVSDWKQPVGYFLSSGPTKTNMLHTLLLECIDKLTEIGLDVKLVVADQGSNNRSMFQKHLKVTEENPRFVHNGKEVFVMYDPPHLLKSIRNNMKHTGFSVDGQEVKWEHIEEFYRFDRINQVHIAPRLT